MNNQNNQYKKDNDQYQVYSRKYGDNSSYQDKIKDHMLKIKKVRKDNNNE